MNIKNACHHEQNPMQGTCILDRLLGKLNPITLILACIFLCIQTASAQTLTLTDTDKRKIDLVQFVQVYKPGLQSPDLAAITQLDERQWQKAAPLNINDVAQGIHSTWYKLNISNTSSSNQILILSDISPFLENIATYRCDEKNVHCEEITTKHTNSSFTLFIEKNKSIVLLIKTTGFGASLPGILLQHKEEYERHIYSISFYAALIDGIIISLIIYTFILGVRTKQNMYLSYCLLGSTSLLSVLLYQKLPTSILQFTRQEYSTILAMAMPPLALIMTIQFALVFTEAKKYHPKTNKLLMAMIAISLTLIFLFINKQPLIIVLSSYFLTACITYIIIYYLCLTCRNHTITTRMLLIAGASMPASTALITALLSSGTIKSNFHSMYITQAFTAMEMLFYSFSMMSSVKNLQNQHEIQEQSTLREIAVSETLNKLLSHLNHELRTPLNGILGATEILIHKSHPRDRHLFSMIHHTATPLKHLIDRLVSSTSINEESNLLTESRFDLQSLLQECMDIFLATAQTKNLRLFFTADNSIANDVTGDENKLRQILLNLVGNACKFTQNGEVSISVSEEKSKNESLKFYRFEIKDTGEGVSEENQKKLFEAFETINTSKNPQGTGLGLNIVLKLSDAMGGKCGYQPNNTRGSIFWASIPLKSHQTTQRKAHSAFENNKILIVDESIDFCKALTNHISDKAQSVKFTSNIAETEKELLSNNYSMVVLQKKLAENDFLNLLRQNEVFYVIYQDTNETSDISQDYHLETIVRKTSIQEFSLQIAEILIKRLLISKNKKVDKTDRNKKILIAEDIISNQLIIIEMVQSLSLKAEVCSNGRQAVSLYKENQIAGFPYDAILMDCEMPVMDGFEATSQIREYEKRFGIKRTPIISLTAHTESSYRFRSQESGMDAYLTKPVTVERILQSLLDLECI